MDRKRNYNELFKSEQRSSNNSSDGENENNNLPRELTEKFGALHCKLCNVTGSSTANAKIHYAGKLHRKNLEKFLEDWSERTGEPLPKLSKPEEVELKQGDTYCDVCKLVLTSVNNAEEHYAGKNHIKALRRGYQINEKSKTSINVSNNPTEKFGIGMTFLEPKEKAQLKEKQEVEIKQEKENKWVCELCNVRTPTEEQLSIHLMGSKHLKAVKRSQTPYAIPAPEPCDYGSSPVVELNAILSRLEDITSRLEKTVSTPSGKQTTTIEYKTVAMSVVAYNNIIRGPLSSYLSLSSQIGGVVELHAKLVGEAFQTQLQYIQLAASRAAPSFESEKMQLLQSTSQKIQAIQDLREKKQASLHFNHLRAISESIPALDWVTMTTPVQYVMEMSGAGKFYTNQILKDWEQTDQKHVNWAKAWVETLSELQKYIERYHTTGLVCSGTKSGDGALPQLGDLGLDYTIDKSALFAEINQGENITRNLKKITAVMQTHKNPGLRSGPALFKASASTGARTTALVKPPAANKLPTFARCGRKWLVEHQHKNQNLIIDEAEMNNVVYMYGCTESTLIVKGKLNSIFLDSCKKTAIVFDSLISSIEFVNCQSVQMQVLGKVPTISIDKTDGCQIYLSKDSLEVEIITSKSSEINVLVPKENGDFAEFPVPEQFKTTVKPTGLTTVAIKSKSQMCEDCID
ncbi:adenylyl cyclase-associated protein 1-like [Lycorma delicatula]|uniref:adenylyl cyclase-associated protein 1-like n=1 Tax=Lycorma delicatula TaxID=130591 RepID=UPI003F50E3AD